MSAAHLSIVECRKVLGGERDPLRLVWDEKASLKDRKFLLQMAGEPLQAAAWRASYAWTDLRPELRSEIARKLKQFAGWAARLQE